ncbi:MAG TPA: MarR family transcriptional regulator [Mycobacteriales bacterium]|nr:MarR family transcriptional regulator [Mycobacteriales bacterium]
MLADVALASELRTSVMRLARRLRRMRADSSLSLGQLAALGTLDRHGPMTPGELAAHERVQPPSMTRIVKALEETGYVTRTPHATDGRQVVVALTTAGALLLKEDRKQREEWLAQRLRALDPDDRELLHRAAEVLDRLGRS